MCCNLVFLCLFFIISCLIITYEQKEDSSCKTASIYMYFIWGRYFCNNPIVIVATEYYSKAISEQDGLGRGGVDIGLLKTAIVDDCPLKEC